MTETTNLDQAVPAMLRARASAIEPTLVDFICCVFAQLTEGIVRPR
jgi:hypothetical protein